ncbi:39S ribosomal protein L48, mitochondrial [Condylostylus longicornis]|uniref:39S ribosomal protein L48, mitochondrial n=1 Tax=Condylostylus longicornis TaxID=2530218 RepID=UPI00244E3BAB|nr:39S ribosomal protein L48, mitochondrial [Condylostylus longicornis]
MFKKVIDLSFKVRQVLFRSVSTTRKNFKIYEPDYLDSLKSKYPQYECLNFQVKGYDYPILESYQKFLHNVAEYLEMDVSESYASPPQKSLVQRFKPSSSVVEAEYSLTTYERNIQISDMDAPTYPLFLRIAQAALPEGVTLNVFEYDEEFEEKRYVPDRDLLELKAQLENLQGTRDSTKKK